MSMSKKDFIALADAIRETNSIVDQHNMPINHFTPYAIDTLSAFCAAQNSNFKRDRWLAYIAGECGSNGGAIKKEAKS